MTIGSAILATLIVLLGASGSYLLLPHRHGTSKPRRVYALGSILASLGLLGFVSLFSPPGEFLAGIFFYAFSLIAIAAALLTVTSRNPIYSALWFATVVLATAGLFLLAGAEFLAAGTIIVYAGAIIVTFLFVIMLAQMEGKADYDRAARAPGVSSFTCFLVLWCLIYLLGGLRPVRLPALTHVPESMAAERNLLRGFDLAAFFRVNERHAASPAVKAMIRPSSDIRDASGAMKPNVAGLGESLYVDHLLTVELTGALLFVALIAAVVITNPKRPVRPGDLEVDGVAR